MEEKLKIDIGCGRRKRKGFVGIDVHDFGQEYVLDVRAGLPFTDNSVDEARAGDFLEHLTPSEAIALLNEVWRVLKPDALFHIVVPYALHEKAYVLPHRSFYTPATFRDLERGDRWEVYGIRPWKVDGVVLDKRNDVHANLRAVKEKDNE